MDRRTLGKDLEVSALGFGCVGISHGYGNALPREEGSARIWQTFDAGVTFFDTAKCYGPYTNDRTGIPTRFRLVRGLGHGFLSRHWNNCGRVAGRCTEILASAYE
jgi:hypothetical protein